MNKTIPVKISLFLLSITLMPCLLAAQSLPANSQEDTCVKSPDKKSTYIDAEYFIPQENETLRVGGDVCVSTSDQSITTQELIYDDKNQKITIDTKLKYQDKTQKIQAQSAKINLANNRAELSNVTYQLQASNANGSAEHLTTKESTSHLVDLSYSTCPIDNQQWYIKAKSADLDEESETGTFRKMTLRFKGVPILYFPYAKMPLTNKRQSGLLVPEISNSSTNGFDIALPYYFNIAENMDATVTPRYLSKRGAMLGTQFRYLGKSFNGEINAEYLPSDRIDKIDRGLVDYKHNQNLSSQWFLNSRLRHVSDNQYFEDFGYNINTTSQTFVYSYLTINGYGDNWNFNGQLNDYQIISDTISLVSQPYQTLPKLSYNYFIDNNSLLRYGFDSQWVNFYKEKSITATRLDLMPYIEKSFQNNYSRLTPRLAYRTTNWDYSDTEFSNLSNLTSSRSLPIASLDYTLNFEKSFNDGSFSTIEPHLYYLYAPFRNQQDIPLFDSRDLTFGNSLLFLPNAFSGADRQSDANQLSVAISQRHFNNQGKEKWNITLGQIAYFDDRKVQTDNTIETRNTSPIITEFNYFYRNWKATMSVHWDTQINKSERALFKIQHKGSNNSLFNFAYRFRQGKIEQLDSSVVLPLGKNKRFISRWNYSLDANKTIEAIAGFEFKNCCWAARLIGRRHIFNETGDSTNGIYFELQLDGLGAIGRNPRRLLKQSILGYSEEF
jgi:LPS-assembly protein